LQGLLTKMPWLRRGLRAAAALISSRR